MNESTDARAVATMKQKFPIGTQLRNPNPKAYQKEVVEVVGFDENDKWMEYKITFLGDAAFRVPMSQTYLEEAYVPVDHHEVNPNG